MRHKTAVFESTKKSRQIICRLFLCFILIPIIYYFENVRLFTIIIFTIIVNDLIYNLTIFIIKEIASGIQLILRVKENISRFS